MITKLRTMTATAMLLSLAYAPQALAVTYYDFTTTISSVIAGGAYPTPADRLFTARFTTDASPTATTGFVNITGISGFLGTGTNAQRVLTSLTPIPGPYFGSINLGATGPLTTPGVGRIAAMTFSFSRGAPLLDMPWTMNFTRYNSSGVGLVNVDDTNELGGGGSPFSLVRVPEIDGGVLPRALFVLSGIFLIAFGRKQAIG